MAYAPNTVRRAPSTVIFAVFLIRLAKHLALLGCLAILGQASGRMALGQGAILLLVIAAALLHRMGQTLQRRTSTHDRTPP